MSNKVAFMIGSASSITGVLLAISAQFLAWGSVTGFSPPRSETSYAVQERVLQQIGLMILAFGLAVVLLAVWSALLSPHRATDSTVGSNVSSGEQATTADAAALSSVARTR